MSDQGSNDALAENIDSDAKKIMATEILAPLDGRTSPNKPLRQLPEANSKNLFMGAPLMTVKTKQQLSLDELGEPDPIEGVPRGLEYLVSLDTILFVNQSIDVADEVVGIFQASNWHLLNSAGQRLYIAAEKKYDRKTCCPSRESRPFNVTLIDYAGQTVLKMTRPVTCSLCWWGGDSCGSVVSILDSDDNLLGFIRQRTNPCVTTYEVYNNLNHIILHIKSTKCKCWYTRGKNEFEVYRKQPLTTVNSNVNESKVPLGKIKKNWSGFSEVTSADTFGITMPGDMDVNMKAVLIGAVFLVDFQFFEQRDGKCTGCFLLLIGVCLIIVSFLFGVTVTSFMKGMVHPDMTTTTAISTSSTINTT